MWWIDLYVAGQPRYRASTRTRDKTLALAKHAEIERALRLGLGLAAPGRTQGATLEDLFARALAQHWRGQAGVATVMIHRDTLLSILGARTRVVDVAGRVDKLVEALHVGRSAATVNRTIQTLRKALALAVEWGMIDKAPKLPRFAEAEGRIRVYTPDEEAAILRFFDAQDAPLGRLTRILFATGWRLAEALKRDRMVLGAGCATVWDTKSGGGRTVPVSPATQALLVDWLAGEGCTKDAVEWRWRRMRAALALGDDAVIHAIRHTCITRLIRGGMVLPKVMLWAGHRDIQTTMRYTHLSAEDLVEGVALVGAGVPQPVPYVCREGGIMHTLHSPGGRIGIP